MTSSCSGTPSFTKSLNLYPSGPKTSVFTGDATGIQLPGERWIDLPAPPPEEGPPVREPVRYDEWDFRRSGFQRAFDGSVGFLLDHLGRKDARLYSFIRRDVVSDLLDKQGGCCPGIG